MRVSYKEAVSLFFLSFFLSFFFFFCKSLLFKYAIFNKPPGFHIAQLSNQTGDYLGQGTQPNSSPFSGCHLAPQISLVMTSEGPESQRVYTTFVCLPLHLYSLQ